MQNNSHHFLLSAVVIIASLLGVCLLSQRTYAALHTHAQIESKVIGGNANVISWDSKCYDKMTSSPGTVRDKVNQGAYTTAMWVSKRWSGNSTSIKVAEGASTVDLQLNYMVFLCSAVVEPDGKGANYEETFENGLVLGGEGQHPNDRRPNTNSSSDNYPSLSAVNYKAFSATVSGPNGGGSITPNIKDQVRGFVRDDSSRFWFAGKIDLVHHLPSGLSVGKHEFIIQIKSRGINQFGSIQYCQRTDEYPADIKTSGWNFDPCHYTTGNFSIIINVEPSGWEIYPSASVEDITGTNSILRAAPGQYITWRHRVKNTGPNETNKPIAYQGSSKKVTIGSGWDADQTASFTTPTDHRYQVTQNNVGHSVCRNTVTWPWKKDAVAPNDKKTSSNACVKVPYHYTLTPDVKLNPTDVVESGSPLNVVSSVSNSGPTKSISTTWGLKRSIQRPGQSEVVNDPVAAGYSGSRVFNVGSPTGLSGYTDTVSDYPVGTKICYTLYVHPRAYKSDGTPVNETASDTACVTIGKKPKVQIWGGDLMAGGKIQTSKSTISDGTTYGSWGEYGVFAGGVNSGMASGASLVNGSSKSVCENNRLSFANVKAGQTKCSNTKPVIGNYSNITFYDVTGSFTDPDAPISGSSFTPVSDSNPSGTYTYNGTLDLTLENPSNIELSKSIIINAPNATVKIVNDQTYAPGSYTDIKNIPQLVIIAKNITIADDVTQVDAWLIAKEGEIKTCTGKPTNAKSCPKQLKINGPVIAKKLYLYRTAGSNTKEDLKNAAEIINLRADAYLWAYNRTQIDDRIRTTSNTDLAPRY